MKCFRTVIVVAGLGLGAAASAWAADVPPVGAMPLSEILAPVPGIVVEVEFDDRVWEIKSCTDAGCEKRDVDPHTGQVLRRRDTGRKRMPPAGATPSAAALAQRLEAAGVGVVTEVEFEHGYWEVKLAVPLAAP